MLHHFGLDRHEFNSPAFVSEQHEPDILRRVPSLGGQLSALRVVYWRMEDGYANVAVLQRGKRQELGGEWQASKLPSFRKNSEARKATNLVNVGMPHFTGEPQGGRGIGVISWELHDGLEEGKGILQKLWRRQDVNAKENDFETENKVNW